MEPGQNHGGGGWAGGNRAWTVGVWRLGEQSRVVLFFLYLSSFLPPSLLRSALLPQIIPSPSPETSGKPGRGAIGGRRELCRGKGKGWEKFCCPLEERESLQPAVSREIVLL